MVHGHGGTLKLLLARLKNHTSFSLLNDLQTCIGYTFASLTKNFFTLNPFPRFAAWYTAPSLVETRHNYILFKTENFHWPGQHGLSAIMIMPCSTNIESIRMIFWDILSSFLQRGIFKKYFIITNSELHALLAMYHLISNKHYKNSKVRSWNKFVWCNHLKDCSKMTDVQQPKQE